MASFEENIEVFNILFPDSVPFLLFFGQEDIIRIILLIGSVISYIVLNVFICVVLFQKSFLSPATVLIQGLAIADGLTAICTYGIEPLFLKHYQSSPLIRPELLDEEIPNIMTLRFPYCSVYFYMKLLSDYFHLISTLLTASMGMQKVIAIKFPIWTRNNLTIKKSCMCCAVCVIIATGMEIPLYIAANVNVSDLPNFVNVGLHICQITTTFQVLDDYTHKWSPLLTAILNILLCLVMVISSLYIVFKLCTNKFRSQVTSKQRRSVILILLVLFIFLLLEIPRIIANVNYLILVIQSSDDFEKSKNLMLFLTQDMALFKALSIVFGRDIKLQGRNVHKFDIARNVFEISKLCTVVACISNFIIYVLMSEKLRSSLFSFCRRRRR